LEEKEFGKEGVRKRRGLKEERFGREGV